MTIVAKLALELGENFTQLPGFDQIVAPTQEAVVNFEAGLEAAPSEGRTLHSLPLFEHHFADLFV